MSNKKNKMKYIHDSILNTFKYFKLCCARVNNKFSNLNTVE